MIRASSRQRSVKFRPCASIMASRYQAFAGVGLRLDASASSSSSFSPPSESKRAYFKFPSAQTIKQSNRPADIDDFLLGYPDQIPNPRCNVNLDFYRGTGRMMPEDKTYEEFMSAYENDYDELERNHGYIQWLFPIREKGLNYQSQPLQPHEIQAMSTDRAILARILRSYRMMLAFYGIDFNQGHLRLTLDCQERLENLAHSPHNCLRITRILKHLSEIPPLAPHVPVLVLFLTALHSEGYLRLSLPPYTNMPGKSLDQWWSNCIRDDDIRKEVRRIVKARGRKGDADWGFERFDEWYADCKEGWTGGLGEVLEMSGWPTKGA